MIIFNFCGGMEQPPQRHAYNPEATERLKNLFVPSTLDRLMSWVKELWAEKSLRAPRPLLHHYFPPDPCWSEKIRTLVEQGADPNVVISLMDQKNALDVAIYHPSTHAPSGFHANENLIWFLLEHGANPNRNRNNNLIIQTLSWGNDWLRAMLLAHGADPTYKTEGKKELIAYVQHLTKQKIP